MLSTLPNPIVRGEAELCDALDLEHRSELLSFSIITVGSLPYNRAISTLKVWNGLTWQ
jgi:hypothetical protein